MYNSPLKRYNEEKGADEVWRCKNVGNTLWGGRTFCFIGFNELNSPAMQKLVERFLSDIIDNGGSFILEDQLTKKNALPTKDISIFVCNYARGYSTRPHNAIDQKTATPLWLYFCHKDQRRYSPSYHPLFEPNAAFNPSSTKFKSLRFHFVGLRRKWLKVRQLFGTIALSKHDKARYYDDEEIVKRFVVVAGGQFILNTFSDEVMDGSGEHPTHIISSLSAKPESLKVLMKAAQADIPVVDVDWIYDSYKMGEPVPEERYLIQLSKDGALDVADAASTLLQETSDSDASTHRRLIFKNGMLYLSHYAVSVNPSLISQCEKMGATQERNLLVVDPIYLLLSYVETSSDANRGGPRVMHNKMHMSEHLPFRDVSTILIIDETEWKTGLFDELAIYIEQKVSNDVSLHSDMINKVFQQPQLSDKDVQGNGGIKKDRLNDIAIALPHWISVCWKHCGWVAVSTDTGGIQIPSNLLKENLLELKGEENGGPHGKRRKSGYTLHDLANSVVYGDAKGDSYSQDELQKKCYSRQKRAEDYRRLVGTFEADR